MIARQLAPVLGAVALLASACGGGSSTDVRAGVDTAESAAPTEPPAPATAEVADSTPDATPGATDTGSDGSGELTPYCRSSAEFYVTAAALNHLDPTDDAAARAVYDALPDQLDAVIADAPTPADTVEPERLQASLVLLGGALDSVEWDPDALLDLPNSDEIVDALAQIGRSTELLESYLESSCELELARLDDSAREVAGNVATKPLVDVAVTAGESTASAPSDVAAPAPKSGGAVAPDFATAAYADGTGEIVVSLPAAWAEVDGEPDGAIRQLTVAPDLGAFRTTFAEPGISIVSGPVEDGALAARSGLDAIVNTASQAGCTVGDRVAYGDGLYTGEQLVALCSPEGTATYMISGANAENNVFFLVILVEPTDLPGLFDLVTSTFRVD